MGIERAKVAAPSKCRTGECGYCRSRLISGDVFIPEDTDGRRAADKIHGYIHPCASFPISDIVIEIPKE
ncbi:MAG: 2Fe-2S iron-sulfur cluster binding domain-containing protein [Clostridia bacterium]|nr:2Fe-2S iron-sulfur cluster binding domain-containing protein [Clostridia bacterium]MBT7122552.1 2Fe-2S iron-sulfur cluster binding domain-containing protein [Clostridia bacterium]